MTSELKQKWIEALRSRKYKKCKSKLKDKDSFCANGLLCEVSGIGWWNNDYFIIEVNEYNQFYKSRVPKILRYPQEDYVSHLNDSEDKSFEEIADWIETNIKVENNEPRIETEVASCS